MFRSSIVFLVLSLFFFAQGEKDFCENSEVWFWTPWFNLHKPTSKGEYELHSAIRSENSEIVCSSPVKIEAKNSFGVEMNKTLDFIVFRSFDLFCLNNYDPKFQGKICDDYAVRFCCPKKKNEKKNEKNVEEEIRQIFIESNRDATKTEKEISTKFSCGRAARNFQVDSNPLKNFFSNLFGSKIINGVEARPNSWPWLISLGIRYRGANGVWLNRTHICGGTLISTQHVLTAAHCLEQKIDDRFVPLTATNPNLESFFILRIGIHDIRETNPEDLYRPRKIFLHERFVPSIYENDVAVIQLDRPVPQTDFTTPICLPQGNVAPGRTATVAGWGTVSETARVHSNVLRQANVTVLPPVNCRVYQDVRYDATRQLCAAALDWSKDTCAGDSGGPLMYSEGGSWTIGGVTSYGYGCAKRGFPGVYARVASYSNWIKQKMLTT